MDAADLYLDLLKGCLTRTVFPDEQWADPVLGRVPAILWNAYKRYRKYPQYCIVAPDANSLDRVEGRNWPRNGETMIGHKRLDNIQHCVTRVLEDNVPGDLIEAGVWRGGASIFMRAVLAAHGIRDRTVWLADSFEGLPVPNPEQYPGDRELDFTVYPQLSVGVDQVRTNFDRYGLLDDKVQFLVGWFKDTLPVAPIDTLAVVRLDGDLYESTMDAITALYPKLSVGGYLIVDDYRDPGFANACRQALDDYRAAHDITEPIQEIDWTGVYWRRES